MGLALPADPHPWDGPGLQLLRPMAVVLVAG